MGTVLDKNSSEMRKRIAKHTFEDEAGEEYEGSEFNGFGDYMRRKKLKLQNLDATTRGGSDRPQIFKGIVAHVTGYTQPPLHILHRDIVQHGGGFLQYLDAKTMATHIIASTLPPKKTVDFSRYRIVKPAWIVDSVNAGKLMPWADYRVLDEGPRQKVLAFDHSKRLTQSTPQTKRGYREQTDDSYYTGQFKGSTLPTQQMSQFVEKYQTPSKSGSSSSAHTPLRPGDEVVSAQETRHSPITDMPSKSDLEDLIQDEEDLSLDVEEVQREEAPEPAGKQPEDDPFKGMTSEEHNAWLLSDPRLRKSSTANPNFLKQFYSESRLHHLSTWKAELKSRMQRLAAEKGPSETKTRRKPGSRRYVMHVDFDSFFCAVSLKKHPEYVDKPTVVAHGSGNGSEIASCNYPARKFGVKNGMWMKSALAMCPDLKVFPYDFPGYEDASRLFYESILDTGGVVQSVSIDEALIDITAIVLSSTHSQGVGIDEGSIWREQEKADDLALHLRKQVKERTGCEVSVGIGNNILQAKVALRKAKPAGQYQMKPEDVLNVIGELKVEDLPGVAYSIGGKLEEIGVKLVKDLRDVPKDRLTQILGPKTSEKLRDYSRGIDRVEVGEQPPRKSVSAEVSWGVRFITQQEAEEFVYNLSKELEKRLLNEQVKGRQLTVKIMRRCLDAPLDPAKHLGHGKCDTFNKSTAFGVATHSWEAIGKEAVSVLRSYKFSPGDIRGLGVQMQKLEQIKSNPAAPQGSQKRLSFGGFAAPSPAGQAKQDPIDDIESPQKASGPKSREADPIADEPFTPFKAKVHPAMALSKAAEEDSKARTPLNVSGTQFIMPSNVDPAVLAELPSDIRSKLMAQRAKPSPVSKIASPFDRSRSGSPAPPADALPSQVDAEVFNALPDDMKAEVLASYGRRPTSGAPLVSPSRRDGNAVPRKQATPTKRGGIRAVSGKGQRQRDARAGLVQTNFKALRPVEEPVQVEEVMELDPEFLAELPEDVRKEVIADHRRRKLAQRSGLDAPARKINHAEPVTNNQSKIHFRALPPRISFASSGVSSTSEIKDMLDAWHSETKFEGPHRGDVEVFEKYLARIVTEEKDAEKASKLVKWLDVIVRQDGGQGKGQESWERAVGRVREDVQRAARERGFVMLNM